MKIDDITSRVLLDCCKELNLSKEEGLEIITGYYKAVRHIMCEGEKGTIKLDLLGKLNFSFAYQNKLKEIKEEKIQEEFKIKFIK